MIVRLIMMNFGPGMQSEGEKVADQFAPIYKTFKGFKNATFFFDYEIGYSRYSNPVGVKGGVVTLPQQP